MKVILFSTLLVTTGLQAQLRSPGIPAKDQKVTNAQADQIFKTLRAVNFEAKEVVYPIYSGDGKLLTKASEIISARGLFTVNRAKEAMMAQILGFYAEHDLAVLKVLGLKASAAKWADAETLNEGAFLASVRSDGEAQAMGVLSVRERSIKSTDQGFLGVRMDRNEAGKGVRVENVERDSAAAAAGIRPGDVITMIEGKKVKGFYELSTRLRRLSKGEQPEIELLRDNKSMKVKPTLKGREVQENEPRRLQRMDRMSGSQSRVRDDFGNVLQSDMELEANDAGLPVVDLEGRIVGMVIARAGRISTLILPGDDIAKTLKTEPEPYVPAPRTVRRPNGPAEDRRARTKRELEMMRQTMEHLQRELDRE
jgi:serine protease Do